MVAFEKERGERSKRSLLRDKKGAELVEKLILICLGALGLIVAVVRFSGSVKQVFDNSGRNLEQNLSASAEALPKVSVDSEIPSPKGEFESNTTTPHAPKLTLLGRMQAAAEWLQGFNARMSQRAEKLEQYTPDRVLGGFVDGIANRIDHAAEPAIDHTFRRFTVNVGTVRVDPSSIVKGVLVDFIGGTVHLAASTYVGAGLCQFEARLLTDPLGLMGDLGGNFAGAWKRDPIRLVSSLIAPLPLAKLRLAAGAEELSQVERASLAVHEELTNTLSKAETVLGRSLSDAEQLAVIRAHYVGGGELGADKVNLAGIGNYTTEQLLAKDQILKEAGLNPLERRILRQQGVVGLFFRTGGPRDGFLNWVARQRGTADPRTGQRLRFKNGRAEAYNYYQGRWEPHGGFTPTNEFNKTPREATFHLRRPLTLKEQDAVNQAHEVGQGEMGADGVNPAGIANYTTAQLRKKAEILKEAGFSPEERRILMEKSVVGMFMRTGGPRDGFLNWLARQRGTANSAGQRVRYKDGEMQSYNYYQGRWETGGSLTPWADRGLEISPDAKIAVVEDEAAATKSLAAQVLGRRLTARQEQAVVEAHLAGQGELGADGVNPAAVGNYTEAQLRAKAEILAQAGFNQAERRQLMENGVVGMFMRTGGPRDGFLNWLARQRGTANSAGQRVRYKNGEMQSYNYYQGRWESYKPPRNTTGNVTGPPPDPPPPPPPPASDGTLSFPTTW